MLGHPEKKLNKTGKLSNQSQTEAAMSPQMDEVAQRAALARNEGLPVGLIVGVAANGNRKGSLA